MAPSSPTKHKRYKSWSTLAQTVIETQGAIILKDLLQRRTEAGAPTGLSPVKVKALLSGAADKLRHPDWKGWSAEARNSRERALAVLQHQLSPETWKSRWATLRDPQKRWVAAARTAQDSLETAAFSGGFALGMALPHLDITLASREKEGGAFTLHAAALFGVQVGTDWVDQVLSRTLLSPELSPVEARWLRLAVRTARATRRGAERGWATREALRLWTRFWKNPAMRQHRIATTARAIQSAKVFLDTLRR
ncbi:hypothetical protein K2X33_11970 [bacterium]|nr:hypothetical protein [bacterium]